MGEKGRENEDRKHKIKPYVQNMWAVMPHVQTHVLVWFQGAQQPTQEAMLTVTNHVLQRWNKGFLFLVPRPKKRMHIAFWTES